MFASVNADEAGVGMVSRRLALGDERLRLLIGKTLVDNIQDLLFRHGRVFQPANLLAGERRQSLDAPVNDFLDGRIRNANQLQRDRLTAENVDLIGLCHLQNLGIAAARARKVHRGIGAREIVMMRPGGFQKRQAKIIGRAGVLKLRELCNLRIAGL